MATIQQDIAVSKIVLHLIRLIQLMGLLSEALIHNSSYNIHGYFLSKNIPWD